MKIPGVCEACHLVRRIPGGELGETEESLSVLLSFESVFNSQSHVRIYKLSC